MSPLRRKLLRDIGRHRAQFIAVAVTVFLGVAVFAASYDSFRNLEASYAQTFVDYRFADLGVRGGDVEAFAANAEARPEVDAVFVRSVADLPFRVRGTKLLGRIVGFPGSGQPPVNQVQLIEGSLFDADLTTAVLVEEHMAEHFALSIGSELSVHDGSEWRDLRVTGVVSSPEYIWPARDRQEIITSPDNFGVIFAPQRLVAAITGIDANEVVLTYAPGFDPDGVTADLTATARSYGAVEVTPRDLQPSNAALSEDIKGFEETALFFPILFLSAAGMAAYVMISRLVYAQRPHIGVMMANGYTGRQMLGHYLGYGVLPGLAGAMPGAAAGIWLARVITRLYTGLLSIPVTVVEFYPITIAAALAFGLVVSALAALGPALIAARVAPAAAMRGEIPAGRGRVSWIERAIPLLRRTPIRWRMALRSIGRNPKRTSYTMVGVVLSLVLVLVSWGMLDTVDHLLDRQFVQIQRQDATVYFTEPVAPSRVAALSATAGVAAAEPVTEIPATLTSATASYTTSLVGLDSDTDMHRFASTGGEWIELPETGLLVGRSLRAELGVEIGDRIGLTVGSTGLELEDAIEGFLDEPLGTVAYAARPHLDALAGSELPVTSAFIRYDVGADPATVRSAVTGLQDVAAFEDANAVYTTVQDFMVLFYGFVGVMLVFGATMAFALMFNAMSVNVAERSRELATLLAVGTRRKTISRLVTFENLLVTLAAIPVGLVAGHFVAAAAMASFASDMFRFDLYIRPTTYLYAALAMVVVALISQRPGLRMMRRFDIPQIVKERSA